MRPGRCFLRSTTVLFIITTVLVPAQIWAGPIMGGLVVTGNGPEEPILRDLARAFEKSHRGTYVDFEWNIYAKTLQKVRNGEADVAVTGKPAADLTNHQVAWDGIAIMVSISNKIKDVTSQHIADIFTGEVKFWSDIGGPDQGIRLINRHPTQHLTHAFEQILGIAGKIPRDAIVIGPEQKTTNAVVGTLPPYSAVTYMSLTPALAAVKSGVNVRLLPIDKVEPEGPTVKDGRYPLRRPVLFVTRKEVTPVTQAFLDFVLSSEGQDIVSSMFTPLDR